MKTAQVSFFNILLGRRHRFVAVAFVYCGSEFRQYETTSSVSGGRRGAFGRSGFGGRPVRGERDAQYRDGGMDRQERRTHAASASRGGATRLSLPAVVGRASTG